MPPYPSKSKPLSADMTESIKNINGIDNVGHGEAEMHTIATISSLLPHATTQDPLICSDQSVSTPNGHSATTSTSGSSSLSILRRLLYGLAAPPSAMCGNILGFLMSVYLLDVAKLKPSLVLTISFTGRFWDAVSDPIVGYLVSRTSTRWGKSRPWVLASAPFCGFAFFLFFNVPGWDSIYGRFLYYLIVYLSFCTFLTTYHIPYTSMTMLICDRSAERDSVTTVRMILEMLGTLCGVMTFTFITQHGPDRCKVVSASNGTGSSSAIVAVANEAEVTPEEEGRYRLGAGIIACVVLLCGCVGFFGTRELLLGAVGVVRPSGGSGGCGGWCGCDCLGSMLAAFRRCLRHRAYRHLMLTFMLSSLAIQTVQNSLALYTIHSLRMKPHLKFAIAIVMSTAILATPLVFFLIGRLGKKRVFYIGLSLILPVCLSATLCPAEDRMVPLYYVTMLVAGCFVSVNMLLPWIMLPDVIDDFSVAAGRIKASDASTFYSLYVFFNKFAVGISTACLQLALHLTGYQQPPACTQPHSVAIALRCIIGPLPMVLVVLAFIALRQYPITAEYRARLDDKLALLKQQAAVENALAAASVDCERIEATRTPVDS